MQQFFDLLIQLLQTGFGFWSIILFFQVRRLKKAQTQKDTREVWRQIAESNDEALLKQNNEIRTLREALSKLQKVVFELETILNKMVHCRHYANCPARYIVQEYKTNPLYRPNRQSEMAQKGIRYPRDNPASDRGIKGTGGQPP